MWDGEAGGFWRWDWHQVIQLGWDFGSLTLEILKCQWCSMELLLQLFQTIITKKCQFIPGVEKGIAGMRLKATNCKMWFLMISCSYIPPKLYVESKNWWFLRLEASCWNMVATHFSASRHSLFWGVVKLSLKTYITFGFGEPIPNIGSAGLFLCFAGWNWASSLGNGFCAALSSAKLADGKMFGVKHITSSCVRRNL